MALFRWLGVLMFLSLLSGLVAFGVIPSALMGMAHLLLGVYLALLVISLCIGIVLL